MSVAGNVTPGSEPGLLHLKVCKGPHLLDLKKDKAHLLTLGHKPDVLKAQVVPFGLEGPSCHIYTHILENLSCAPFL